jgi:PAS domain S-box-containing protein
MISPMAGETHGIQRQGEPLDLRSVIDTIPALVVCVLSDGSVEFVNQSWLEYTGFSLEHLAPWGWTTVMHPDDISKFTDEWNAARAAGKPFENEARMRRGDGQYRWFSIRKVPLRERNNQIVRWYGTGHDIDNRKQAEDGLRQSEAQFQLAIDAIPGLVWSALPDGHVDFLNQRWREYTGLTLNDASGWGWQAAIHPQDLPALLDYWNSVLASGKPGETEARLQRFDGGYRWFLFRAVPLYDETGKLVKWYGQTTDIEDHKQAEEKIREQEAGLRQMLDLTPQHVHVLTADARLLYSNEIALKYHGSMLDDWSDRQLRDWRTDKLPITLFHPDDRERVLCELKATMLVGTPHETEARLVRNDGRYLWFLFRYRPLRDEQGRVMRWYVAGTDIEDRKQAEERLKRENVALREEIDKASMFEEIVGSSPALRAVLSLVSKVAPTDSTVLITGETGTGKELIARAIHRQSRSSRAFVSVNCAAIPRDLIASELFGHERGSFTGATQQRLGRFELAGGGTIFLDEVGELPFETQIALLRVLQENEFERVGGTRSIRADVRVIAATNRDLQAAVAAGTFRNDLFYRLNVFPIEMPPLRERREDLPMLVEYFIDRYTRKAGKTIRGVNKKSMELLQAYPWPGNIRELQNIIERSVIVCESENFSVDESWLSRQPTATEPKSPLELSEKLAAQEKEIIEAALRECKGRVYGPAGAATKLGMPRSTLESKIRSLKIDKNRFRTAVPSNNT